MKNLVAPATRVTTGVGRAFLGSLFALMLAAVIAVTLARAVAS